MSRGQCSALAKAFSGHDRATIFGQSAKPKQTFMTSTTLTREIASSAATASRPKGDDKAMLRAAANLTRELNAPNASVYWLDMLGSALVGYGALALASVAPTLAGTLVAALIAILALYRAGSFIHEVTHIKAGSLPG